MSRAQKPHPCTASSLPITRETVPPPRNARADQAALLGLLCTPCNSISQPPLESLPGARPRLSPAESPSTSTHDLPWIIRHFHLQLGSKPGSSTFQLCDLAELMSHSWDPVSSFVKVSCDYEAGPKSAVLSTGPDPQHTLNKSQLFFFLVIINPTWQPVSEGRSMQSRDRVRVRGWVWRGSFILLHIECVLHPDHAPPIGDLSFWALQICWNWRVTNETQVVTCRRGRLRQCQLLSSRPRCLGHLRPASHTHLSSDYLLPILWGLV